MPDPHRMTTEFLKPLMRPQYASMIYHRNQFRKPDTKDFTADNIAAEISWKIWKDNSLLDPVEIVELRGPAEFYRAYDGGRRKGSAGTLGAYWVDRSVVQAIWNAMAKFPRDQQGEKFMEFLRSASFIDQAWNEMREIACMAVPSGSVVVCARGRGHWKVLRTMPGAILPPNLRALVSPLDLEQQKGMMALPGVMQYVIPLWNDSWICQVPQLSKTWPLRG
ncbi:MAG TPA: hypothetical protein VGR47_22810 [Terracidiphilus sp.]|nr:hypothetical protein [Terracidiphilus sp.]